MALIIPLWAVIKQLVRVAHGVCFCAIIVWFFWDGCPQVLFSEVLVGFESGVSVGSAQTGELSPYHKNRWEEKNVF